MSRPKSTFSFPHVSRFCSLETSQELYSVTLFMDDPQLHLQFYNFGIRDRILDTRGKSRKIAYVFCAYSLGQFTVKKNFHMLANLKKSCSILTRLVHNEQEFSLKFNDFLVGCLKVLV